MLKVLSNKSNLCLEYRNFRVICLYVVSLDEFVPLNCIELERYLQPEIWSQTYEERSIMS
jgi:hypothetical protein